MSNEYKEWLKEQSFESLANDNLRIKLELKTAKEENEKLTNYLMQFSFASGLISTGSEFKRCLYGGAFKEAIPNRIKHLTQQNKQMRECLENMANKCERKYQCIKNSKGCIAYTYRKDCYKFNAQQALKGGE